MDLVSRSMWFSAGVAFGVYGFVKARRTAEVFTPSGLQGRAVAMRAGARVFTRAVADGMRERETRLRDRRQLEAAAMTEDRRRQLDPPPEQPRPAVGASDGHR
jgi:hypothetical protein